MQDLRGLSLLEISPNIIMLYYAIVVLGALYTFYRFGIGKITLLIVLLFWEGVFGYLDDMSIFSIGYYKIAVFVYVCVLFGPSIFLNKYRTDKLVNIFFILFSISFWTSCILNEELSLTAASQFCYKYSLPFLFYHGIKGIIEDSKKTDFISSLLYFVVILQVGFSIIKLLLVHDPLESIVGSAQYSGGGIATVLPILGFSLIWLNKMGGLKKKDWIVIVSLLLIGLASAKRSQVFILPFFVLSILVYVQKSIRFALILKYLPIVFLLFFFGVKTNYTLNPEQSTWGSFDFQYLYSYVMQYNFGTEDLKYAFDETTGRGGALRLIVSPNLLGFNNLLEFLFGRGLEDIVLAKYGLFTGERYGLGHKSLTGEGIKLLFTLGYAGLISYFLFSIYIIRSINNKRFRMIVSGFYIWELLLSFALLFFASSTSFLFIFICLYSNNRLQSDSIQIYEAKLA